MIMKKYQDGGQIPQAAQNTLDDLKEERARQKFYDDRKAENQAPKQAVKRVYDKVRSLFGVDKKKTPTTKKAKGGYVTKADGVAKRGKTKGRFV